MKWSDWRLLNTVVQKKPELFFPCGASSSFVVGLRVTYRAIGYIVCAAGDGAIPPGLGNISGDSYTADGTIAPQHGPLLTLHVVLKVANTKLAAVRRAFDRSRATLIRAIDGGRVGYFYSRIGT